VFKKSSVIFFFIFFSNFTHKIIEKKNIVSNDNSIAGSLKLQICGRTNPQGIL